jgi:transcription elongation factor GreB
MSRAFVKDDDDGPEQVLHRPVSNVPNYVTPAGLELLRTALKKAEGAGDDRQARYYDERIESAIVVDPKSHPEGEVEFGATVTAHDAHGNSLHIRIVGEDEADPLHGSVSWESPIAQAFTDHHVGDRVIVQRPAGPIEYVIDSVDYK